MTKATDSPVVIHSQKVSTENNHWARVGRDDWRLVELGSDTMELISLIGRRSVLPYCCSISLELKKYALVLPRGPGSMNRQGLDGGYSGKGKTNSTGLG
jgi:hypothetical protein